MPEVQLKDALDALKKSGVRITPQRHAILEFLISSDSHPTADEIYKSLADDFPNMSVATNIITYVYSEMPGLSRSSHMEMRQAGLIL